MNDFESDFELELHESRPAPRGELLDSLVSKVNARPVPVRRGKWQLRLAGVLAAVSLLGLAGLGGVSVAANAVNSAGGGSQPAAAPQASEDKGVAVCANGSTTVVYMKKKDATDAVEVNHTHVYATGDPPICPAL